MTGVVQDLRYALRQLGRASGFTAVAVRPVAAGVVVGVVLAAGLSGFLGSLLYGLRALDSSTFAAVALVLSAVALAALSALRTDPAHALRSD